MIARPSRFVLALVAPVLVACGGGSEGGSCGIVAPQRTITVSPTSVELDVGGQQPLSGTAATGCAGDPPAQVSWQSSALAIAAVSTAGVVTAVGPGDATITASAFGGAVTAAVAVKVRVPEVRSVTPSETTTRIRERQGRRITATVVTTGNLTRRVTFTSRAPTIATIRVIDSVSAEINGVTIGSTVVDIVAAGDTSRRAAVAVTVDPATVASVRIVGLASTDSLLLGSRRTLSANVRDSSNVQLQNRDVRWASESPTTVTVSAAGELHAVRAGPARVAARVAIGDGTGDRLDTVSTRVYGTLDVAVAPRSAGLEEGQTLALQASVTATNGIDRTIDWESSQPAVASVSAAGVVTGVAQGTVVIRARARTLTTVYDSATLNVVARGVPTTLVLAPRVDTLSPNGTRTLQATVRDQRGSVMAAAPVTWRSLTPALATVSASGTISALAVGEARIVATTPGANNADLADTTRVLIVAPCSLVRPVTLGASYTGLFDASTCRNYIGFDQLDQFSVSSTTQAYYAISLTPTFRASLIPLNIGTGFFGLVALANQTTESLAVIRPGTFGFMVAGLAGSAGPYTVTTSLNPDPRRSCVPTNATTGVTFQTAVSPTCIQRDIRILPPLAPGQLVRITASAPSFPVRIELRSFTSDPNGVLLASAVAAGGGSIATIALTWAGDFTFAFVRVIGGPSHSDVVDMVIVR